MNDILKDAGLQYEGKQPVRHLVEVLIEDLGHDALKQPVKKPLEGIKIAGYVGGWFSVHAAVRVAAEDKAGRERLFRYCARLIFASDCLVWEQRGERLHYRLSKPGARGQTVLTLTPTEFLDRIAAPTSPLLRRRARPQLAVA